MQAKRGLLFTSHRDLGADFESIWDWEMPASYRDVEEEVALVHDNAGLLDLRWLGARELTDYSRIQLDRSRELQQWKEAINLLIRTSPLIFGYFNNHFQGHSPASANQLKDLLGLTVISPDELITQPSLF